MGVGLYAPPRPGVACTARTGVSCPMATGSTPSNSLRLSRCQSSSRHWSMYCSKAAAVSRWVSYSPACHQSCCRLHGQWGCRATARLLPHT